MTPIGDPDPCNPRNCPYVRNECYGQERRPYKCPVCDGSGTLPSGIDISATYTPCPACNGTGIVWG